MSDKPSKRSRSLERLNRSRHPLFWISLASFLESTIVPLPLEIVLIPYYQAHRERIWTLAAVVTLACLAGATLFYFTGAMLLESAGQHLMGWLSSDGGFEAVKADIEEDGFMFILAAGLNPIPFQIAMLAAGSVGYPFLLFLLAAAIARGIRYFGLAWLVLRYGDQAMRIWKENKLKAGMILLLCLALAYATGKGLQRLLE